MKKKPCPRCHAPMNMKPRMISDDEYGIRCSKCRWQHVVIRGSIEDIQKYKDIEKLKSRSRFDSKLKETLKRRRK